MRIVDRKTFLEMPAGTVYSKFVPNVFDGLCIKGGNFLENDFLYTSVVDSVDVESTDKFYDLLYKACKSQEVSIPMDFDIESRDAFFDEDQLFAIFENQDVCQLIDKLTDCLHSYRRLEE